MINHSGRVFSKEEIILIQEEIEMKGNDNMEILIKELADKYDCSLMNIRIVIVKMMLK